MTEKAELKQRVLAKKKELEARVAQLKVDANDMKGEAQAKRQKEIRRLEGSLDELKGNIKDGWDSFTEDVAGKLNGWLRDQDKNKAQSSSQ